MLTASHHCTSEYKKRFLFYKPHLKQEKFHAASTKAIERLFLAGNRTGKTYCGCVEDAIHLTGVYPDWWTGHKFNHSITVWVASENYEITRNVLQKMLIGGYSLDGHFTDGLIHPSLILKKAMLSGVNGAVDYVQIQHSSGGVSSLYFKSYKQGREKFQGARCHLIHLDEEPPKDVYTECSMRLADVDGMGQGRLILTMTPLKGYTEMMSYFLEHRVTKKELEQGETQSVEDLSQEDEVIRTDPEIIFNGKYYIQASWDDNTHLSEETKQQLRSTLKPYELEAREKGIPSVGSGLVYQVMESEFLVEPFEIPHYWPCVFGMDVGFFAPTAVVFMAHDKDNDILYIYKEYSVTEKTAAQHAASLMIMGCDWIPGVCDPAVNQGSQRDGEKLIDDYAKAGLKLNKGKYAKELAVDSVLERIRTGRFKVFKTCRKFMDEWRGYSRDDKGKINKGRDHLMNALEFVILDGLPMSRTKRQVEMRYNYNDKPRFF
jgi:phage terminase large subunit-like protein